MEGKLGEGGSATSTPAERFSQVVVLTRITSSILLQADGVFEHRFSVNEELPRDRRGGLAFTQDI